VQGSEFLFSLIVLGFGVGEIFFETFGLAGGCAEGVAMLFDG
jgi:hypothetical protein